MVIRIVFIDTEGRETDSHLVTIGTHVQNQGTMRSHTLIADNRLLGKGGTLVM